MPSFRTKLILLLLLSVPLIFMGGCQSEDNSSGGSSKEDDDVEGDDDSQDDDSQDDDSGPGEYPFCTVDEDRIEAIASSMSLEEKVAQMYVVGAQVFPGFDFASTRRLVEELGVGGVFLQPGTGIGLWPKWTVRNINKLQSWALGRANPIPLIVACDQEGGIPQAVNELTGGTDQPGNMGLGASFNPKNSLDSYGIMGEQLAALGINNTYSPVAGLMISPEESSMYTRCFGEETKPVADHTREAVRGLQRNLVIATAKHFPSHSTAEGDEHRQPVYNFEGEEAVREKYFPPFIAAIEAGADMIMTTHAVYAAWEEYLPTTLSKKLLTDILRGELGYEGLILTDDMNMGSLYMIPWDEHPDILAIAAGVDLILDVGADSEIALPVHPDNEHWVTRVREQVDTVADAVRSGRLDENGIDASVRRILRTKMKYCLFENPYRDAETVAGLIDTPEQRETSMRLHEEAVTLIRNDDGLWPLDPDGEANIHVVTIGPYQSLMYPEAYWGNITPTTLLWEMQKLSNKVTGGLFDVEPSDWIVGALIAGVENAGAQILVIATYHAYYHEKQQALVRALLDLGLPTIMVATALPYDLMAFPELSISTHLATYSNRGMALEVAARTLFGLSEPLGRLPVSLPGFYEAGWSAYSSPPARRGMSYELRNEL